MGALATGDEIFDERGVPCRVLVAHPVCEEPVSYRVTFDDGVQIDACAEHLWLTFTARELNQLTCLTPEWRAARRAKRPSRTTGAKSSAFTASLQARNADRAWEHQQAPSGKVRTTQEIFETLRTARRRVNHAIPVCQPLVMPEIELPIDPYCLGAWLGDGTSNNGNITSIDAEVWQHFEGAGYQVSHSQKDAKHHCILGLKVQLRALGVLSNKHIPAIYLRASKEQRLALLQGLMDTDGTVTDSGSVEFTNTNHSLAVGSLELINSLGWKARIVEGRAKLNGKDCGPKFDIKWTPSDYVFRLTRKRKKQKLATRRTTRFRYVVQCEPIAPKPMRCITVDSPSRLYLAGRAMVPTHNTDLALGLAITRHRKARIFRTEYTQHQDMIERSRDIIGERGDFNGSSPPTWRRLPGGRQIQFAACDSLADAAKKWKGRPADLMCVGKGTPVRMADGGYRPIEQIREGDRVATLEGPCRVTRVFPVQRKPAVIARVYRNGIMIGQQVQGANHAILTTSGWVSRDSAGVSASMPETFSPTEYLRGDTQSELSLSNSRASWTPRARQCSNRGPSRVLARRYGGRLAYTALFRSAAGEVELTQENDCAKSADQLLKRGLRLLSTVPQEPVQLFPVSGALSGALNADEHDGCDVLACSLLQGYLGDYSGGTRHDDGQLHQSVIGALCCPPQSGDVEPHSPIDFVNDGQGIAPKHNHHTRQYFHPYTKEIRQSENLVPCEVSFELIGERDLYDVTVESANHYITGEYGIVNCNCFDEATEFQEAVVRFLMGWNRTTIPGQRCRVVLTFNPPTTPEGEWIIRFFAPWLDPKHPNPAKPGELRWFAMIEGEEIERPDGQPFWHKARDGRMEEIQPRSRSFIPAKLSDNPVLAKSGYGAQLQALPEPLRSQMLYGDFNIGVSDDPWQVIPTAWVEAAMQRWERTPKPQTKNKEGKWVDVPLSALGVDPSRGGAAKTIIAPRFDNWFAPLIAYQGEITSDGPKVGALILRHWSDNAVINIDALGIGTSATDWLKSDPEIPVNAINSAQPTKMRDKSGKFRLVNMRTAMYWKLREALDPDGGLNICLPRDAELKSDLCAPRYGVTAQGIAVEPKHGQGGVKGVADRLGRSPDKGDAVVYANWIGGVWFAV
jgi:hypothetical protein